MTVEAAFIIPMILFIIFSLMYLTFHLHDKVRLETVIEQALGKDCEEDWEYENGSYKEQEEERIKYLEKELETGFFLLEKNQVSCEINGFSVKIKIVMKENVSLNPVKKLGSGEGLVILERERILHNPEEVLRVYEGLKIVLNYVEDARFVKNYLANNKAAFEKE